MDEVEEEEEAKKKLGWYLSALQLRISCEKRPSSSFAQELGEIKDDFAGERLVHSSRAISENLKCEISL